MPRYIRGIMIMKELAAEERPREKMLERGPQALSNGELLAILIRNGAGGKSALDLAREVLALGGGGLASLFATSASRLCSLHGLGPCKAASVLAAFELGRRFLLEAPSVRSVPIVTARMVYDLMIPLMKGLPHEECWALFLNNANYLLQKTKLTFGGSDRTIIDNKHTVRMALECNASGIILVHNHPSDNPHPSRADVQMTNSLRAAAGTFGIDLVDHVIIGDSRFFSFAEDSSYSA